MTKMFMTQVSSEGTLQHGQQKSANHHAARRNKRIYEVPTDHKDYFKVTADAPIKLEKDDVPPVPCIVTKDSRGNLTHVML